jgi:hypothetical protein
MAPHSSLSPLINELVTANSDCIRTGKTVFPLCKTVNLALSNRILIFVILLETAKSSYQLASRLLKHPATKRSRSLQVQVQESQGEMLSDIAIHLGCKAWHRWEPSHKSAFNDLHRYKRGVS